MMTDRADHEEAPPSKRLKSDKSPTMTLNEDALALVMEFVGPRELYGLAFACKGLRDLVTTKLVLQSTILNTVDDTYPKITLGVLAGCIQQQRIHVPSPYRLLRLVNGKRCEICNVKRVNHVRKNSGCFLCPKCQQKVTSHMKVEEFNGLPEFLQEDSRIGTYRVTECPLKVQLVTPGGERIGQLFSYKDILAIAQSAGGMSADEYLRNILHVPSSAEDCNKWMEEYNNTNKAGKKREKAQKARREQMIRGRIENRKKKLQKFVVQVKNHLDDPWKDFALDFDDTERRLELMCFHGEDYAPFHCPFVSALMKEYAWAPSKAKKKFAAGVARNINRIYQRIQEENLLSFHFLDENEPCEARLKAYALQHWTDLRLFVQDPFFYYNKVEALLDETETENASLIDCWMNQNFGFLLVDPHADSSWVMGLAQSEWSAGSSRYRCVNDHPDKGRLPQEQLVFRCSFRFCESSFAGSRRRSEEFLSWLASEGADESEIQRAQRAIQRNRDEHWLYSRMGYEKFRDLYND